MEAVIDRQGWSGLQVAMLVASLLLLFTDGFDIFMFGKVAPVIARNFGTTPAGLSGVVVAQQVGLACGAIIISPFADRIGRRLVLQFCALGFGLLTMLSAQSTSIAMLALSRGLAGALLAPVVPITLALLSEFTPRQRRTTIVATGLVGYGLGNAGSAFFTAQLLPSYGWTGLFMFCGGVGLLCAALLALLPESLQFLVARDPADPRIPVILRRVDRGLAVTAATDFVLGERKATSLAPLRELWGENSRTTALFWAVSFASMGLIALFAAWLPSFFHQLGGVPVQSFASVASVGLLGGSVGTLLAGALLDRFAARGVISGFYLVEALALVGLGLVPFSSGLFTATLFVWSLTQGGGQAALNVLILRRYPVGLRSTGLGWAGGLGRIGGIIIPLVGSMVLAGSLPLSLALGLLALGPLAIGLVLWLAASWLEGNVSA